MKVELDKGIEKTFNDICMYHSLKEEVRQAIYQLLIKDHELKKRLRERIDVEIARADTAEDKANEYKSILKSNNILFSEKRST